MPGVSYITATRIVNGNPVTTYYVGTIQADNWIYFNDSVMFRCKIDYSNPQCLYMSKGVWIDTNLIKDISGQSFNIGGSIGGNGSVAKDANVEAFVQWCINIANDESHGYDQVYRNGPDYDCSSLIWWGLHENGFDVGSYAFNTDGMPSVLTAAGWVQHTPVVLSELERGDILLKSKHTELYIGAQQNVGAHKNERGGTKGGDTGDQTGAEISITPFYTSSNWVSYWRYQS